MLPKVDRLQLATESHPSALHSNGRCRLSSCSSTSPSQQTFGRQVNLLADICVDWQDGKRSMERETISLVDVHSKNTRNGGKARRGMKV